MDNNLTIPQQTEFVPRDDKTIADRAEAGRQRIYDILCTQELTDKQYCELFAAQQSLAWAVYEFADPVDTVMKGIENWSRTGT